MMSLMSEIAVTVVKIVRATSQVRAPIIRCKHRVDGWELTKMSL